MTDALMRVLVVEDEAAAARVLIDEVTVAPGFAVAGHTCSGADTLRRVVSDDSIDLVLLDIQLPDISGMNVLRRLRAAGCDVDVMAVTVLRDPSMLQAAMALGVVHYLLKPFTAATVRQKLEHYRAFRERRLAAAGHSVIQEEIDEVFTALRAMAVDTRPKGVGQESLHAVAVQLRRSGEMSAAQAAEVLGMSRVTARRYLEYLTESGLAKRGSRYGGTGRPEVEYRWSGDDVGPPPPFSDPDVCPGSST
jgi:response regulator of citrate/malate metabolism